MKTRTSFAALLLSALMYVPALAQFQEGDPGGSKVGDSQVMKWKAGMKITAAGACKGIVGYVPVPTEWPEQQVRVAEEDVSREAKISYQVVDGGVKVMVIRIAHLEPGKEAQAVITFECRRAVILPPEKTDQYVLPDTKKLERGVRPYLSTSPKIECTETKIRNLAKEIGADKKGAWEKVEAIYDWVRENVAYEKGSVNKGAMAALKAKKGDCEGMSSLFIAICRASSIPARLVWVPEHCYPEFYLVDEKGQGHWFPCQAAGSRSFGGIPETKPILQKGDNFRPPYNQKDRKRYLAEYLEAHGQSRPNVQWMRGLVN